MGCLQHLLVRHYFFDPRKMLTNFNDKLLVNIIVT